MRNQEKILDILDIVMNGQYTVAIDHMRQDPVVQPIDIVNYLANRDHETYSWYDIATHDAVCSIWYLARIEDIYKSGKR